MLDKTIVPRSDLNGQKSIEARQFALAFIPNKQPNNLTQLWSLKATEAIGALIDFRSAIHRWQANGKVDDQEFVAELQRLDDAGLADWTDELIALATVANCGVEVTR